MVSPGSPPPPPPEEGGLLAEALGQGLLPLPPGLEGRVLARVRAARPWRGSPLLRFAAALLVAAAGWSVLAEGRPALADLEPAPPERILVLAGNPWPALRVAPPERPEGFEPEEAVAAGLACVVAGLALAAWFARGAGTARA